MNRLRRGEEFVDLGGMTRRPLCFLSGPHVDWRRLMKRSLACGDAAWQGIIRSKARRCRLAPDRSGAILLMPRPRCVSGSRRSK